MSVTVIAKKTVPVAPAIIEASIVLKGHDAQVLRSMLGALTRKERREATGRNGGNKASQDRARFLVKEVIDALDAQGVTRLSEIPITPPDRQAERAARAR